MFPEKQQRLIILRKYFRFTGKITLIKIISTGILIFLLITDSVSGIFSTDDLQVKKWNTGFKTVNCLKQTGDRFIWLGTPSGLFRFDGSEFDKFSHENTPALKNNNISVIYENEKGRMFIGTSGGGLAIKDKNDWYSLNTLNGLSDNHIRSVISDWQGNLWVGTDFGLNCITPDTILTYSREEGLYDNIITALAIDLSGNILAGTFRSGILVIKKGLVGVMGYQDGLTSLSVTAIKHDFNGILWVATMGGLFYLPPGQKKFVLVPQTAEVPINDLLINSDGTVWYASMIRGLVKISEGRHIPVTPDDDFVHCVLEDDDGSVWAGTDTRGLVQIKRKYLAELKILDSPDQPAVTAINFDKNGHLWAAYRNIGLFEIDSPESEPMLQKHISTESQRLTAILFGPGNQLWLGSEDKGLFRILDQKIKEILLPEEHITSLGKAPDESIWIGTPNGIFQYSPQGEIFQYLPGRRINSICMESDQSLVSTDKGIFTRAGNQFEPVIYPELSDILTACYYDSNTILAGTPGNGLLLIRNHQPDTLSVEEGLPVSHIYSIVIDQDIWLTSLRGIVRISRSEFDSLLNDTKQSVNCVWYDESDGMSNARCQPTPAQLSDNILYAPTAAGIAMIRTDTAPPVRHQPHIRLKRIRTEQGDQYISNQTVELPAETELMEIYFASIDYLNPGKHFIQYQLSGIDPQPRLLPPGKKPVLTYHDIAAGNYKLLIKAIGPNDQQDNGGAEIAVIVPLPVYKNPLFITVVLAFVFILSAGTSVVRSRRRAKIKSRKYSTISIDQERTEKVVANLQRIMSEKKLYLDPDLSLKDLAKELNIHPNYLSRILNEFFRQSYNDFINEYRISAAMKRLSDPGSRDTTILQIMYETGFYSKSVFNTAFKNLTGKTPSAYRREHLS